MQTISTLSRRELILVHNALVAERNNCHAQIEAGEKWSYDTSDIRELSDELLGALHKIYAQIESLPD